MATSTLHGTVWLKLKEAADPSLVYDQYATVYRHHDRARYAWLLLYYAVQSSHRELVRQLLDRTDIKVKLGIDDAESQPITRKRIATALNEAVRRNDVETVDLILGIIPALSVQSAFVFSANPRVRHLCTPLELSIRLDHVDVLRVLLRYLDPELGYQNLLQLACISSAEKCLDLLLESFHEYINEKDGDGLTPLLCAAMHQPKFIPRLLARGASVQDKNPQNGHNCLQELSNGSFRDVKLRLTEGDPCPSYDSDERRPMMFGTSDQLFVSPDLIKIIPLLIDHGLDVNDSPAPLQLFCVNYRKKLQDLLGDRNVQQLFKEIICLLAPRTHRQTLDSCLVVLCHQLMFIATQLRRSSDYDNLVMHVEVMESIRDAITVLLDNSADPNVVETADDNTRRLIGLVPYNVPHANELKVILDEKKTATVRNGPLDFILVSLLALSPVQQEEPQLHAQVVQIFSELFQTLSRLGGKCNHLAVFFLVLCIDPPKHLKFLENYLQYQSQSEYHEVIKEMMDLCHKHPVFVEIQKELSGYLARIFSLKDLLRRDIVRYLGSSKCPSKVQRLPLPSPLKNYLLAFWST